MAWYRQHGRTLPWRGAPGSVVDPYRIWLSETMLQQTTVAVVRQRYGEFLARWPSLASLAAASQEEVCDAWAGLGYYARARNLHACAQRVHNDHEGRFPCEIKELERLPGIGPYTAAALAALVYDQSVLPIDTNIKRLLSRLYGPSGASPSGAWLKAAASTLAPRRAPGVFAQALMDLGALICRPHKPQCPLCPLKSLCRSAQLGRLPALPPPQRRKHRHATALCLHNRRGEIYLERRPRQGLLGGLLGFPFSPWRTTPQEPTAALEELFPYCPRPQALKATLIYRFTHFDAHVSLARGTVAGDHPLNTQGLWCASQDLNWQRLPSLMRRLHEMFEASLEASLRVAGEQELTESL